MDCRQAYIDSATGSLKENKLKKQNSPDGKKTVFRVKNSSCTYAGAVSN